MLNTIALTRPLPQLLKTDNGLNLREKYWTNGNMSEGPYRLLTPGNTNVQCLGGVVQRPAATGMPERELVHVPRGHTVQNRGLAHTL